MRIVRKSPERSRCDRQRPYRRASRQQLGTRANIHRITIARAQRLQHLLRALIGLWQQPGLLPRTHELGAHQPLNQIVVLRLEKRLLEGHDVSGSVQCAVSRHRVGYEYQRLRCLPDRDLRRHPLRGDVDHGNAVGILQTNINRRVVRAWPQPVRCVAGRYRRDERRRAAVKPIHFHDVLSSHGHVGESVRRRRHEIDMMRHGARVDCSEYREALRINDDDLTHVLARRPHLDPIGTCGAEHVLLSAAPDLRCRAQRVHAEARRNGGTAKQRKH